MERWLEFMGNHPFLFGILAVLIVLFFVFEGQRNGRKISPQSLGILVKAKNAQLMRVIFVKVISAVAVTFHTAN